MESRWKVLLMLKVLKGWTKGSQKINSLLAPKETFDLLHDEEMVHVREPGWGRGSPGQPKLDLGVCTFLALLSLWLTLSPSE